MRTLQREYCTRDEKRKVFCSLRFSFCFTGEFYLKMASISTRWVIAMAAALRDLKFKTCDCWFNFPDKANKFPETIYIKSMRKMVGKLFDSFLMKSWSEKLEFRTKKFLSMNFMENYAKAEKDTKKFMLEMCWKKNNKHMSCAQAATILWLH